MIVCCLVATVVFIGVVLASSLLSGAGGVASASLLHDVERALTGSSTFFEGEHSAPESFSVVTRSVVESALGEEPAGVSSSVEQVLSVVAGGSLPEDVNVLGPKVERLIVASSSPEPVRVCVRITATVVEDGVTVAACPVDVAVQTEGGSVSQETHWSCETLCALQTFQVVSFSHSAAISMKTYVLWFVA